MKKLKIKLKDQGNLNPILLASREGFIEWLNKMEMGANGEALGFLAWLPSLQKFRSFYGRPGGTGKVKVYVLEEDGYVRQSTGINLYLTQGYGGMPYQPIKIPNMDPLRLIELTGEDHSVLSGNILFNYRVNKEDLETTIANLIDKNTIKKETGVKIRSYYNQIHEELLKHSAKLYGNLFGDWSI